MITKINKKPKRIKILSKYPRLFHFSFLRKKYCFYKVEVNKKRRYLLADEELQMLFKSCNDGDIMTIRQAENGSGYSISEHIDASPSFIYKPIGV